MKKNVGTIDRVIRLVLGTAVLFLGIFLHWGWYIPAAALLFTGIFRFCTPYAILGISTCKIKDRR